MRTVVLVLVLVASVGCEKPGVNTTDPKAAAAGAAAKNSAAAPIASNGSTDKDIRDWLNTNRPDATVVKTDKMPLTGKRTGGTLGEMVEVMKDEDKAKASGKKGKSPPAADAIDGAYLIVVETAAGRGRRYCALQKKGGGVSLMWELDGDEDWKLAARSMVE